MGKDNDVFDALVVQDIDQISCNPGLNVRGDVYRLVCAAIAKQIRHNDAIPLRSKVVCLSEQTHGKACDRMDEEYSGSARKGSRKVVAIAEATRRGDSLVVLSKGVAADRERGLGRHLAVVWEVRGCSFRCL
mgnify:CR=1 FL=1